MPSAESSPVRLVVLPREAFRDEHDDLNLDPVVSAWVKHELRDFGAEERAALSMEPEPGKRTVWLATDLGILVLNSSDEHGQGELSTVLQPWSEVGEVKVAKTTKWLGGDLFESAMDIAIPAVGLAFRGGDDGDLPLPLGDPAYWRRPAFEPRFSELKPTGQIARWLREISEGRVPR